MIENPTYPIFNNESRDLRANDSWNSSNGVRNSHENGSILKNDVMTLCFVMPFCFIQILVFDKLFTIFLFIKIPVVQCQDG